MVLLKKLYQFAISHQIVASPPWSQCFQSHFDKELTSLLVLDCSKNKQRETRQTLTWWQLCFAHFPLTSQQIDFCISLIHE